MQPLYRKKLLIWFAEHPRPPPSSTTEERLLNATYPLRPMVSRFHRMTTVLLMGLVAISAVMVFAMRLIYPQPQTHIDDLSGYEVLMPGETGKPEDYSFKLLTHVPGVSENELHRGRTNTYINSSEMPQVIIIDITYQQEQIVRFTLYSNTFRLQDLLWRWGRPNYKQRDVVEKHWDFMWYEDKYSVSTFSRRLNLDTSITFVRITIK